MMLLTFFDSFSQHRWGAAFWLYYSIVEHKVSCSKSLSCPPLLRIGMEDMDQVSIILRYVDHIFVRRRVEWIKGCQGQKYYSSSKSIEIYASKPGLLL